MLVEGAFDGINPEARGLLYLLAESGLRLSEACNLNERTIVLEHQYPHVIVDDEEREVKTLQSKRQVPLVGVALLAMRLFPKGFDRYRDKADSFSGFANKVLKERKMRLSGESVYSLRHMFKDRLRDAGATDDMMKELMGHAVDRSSDYGSGNSLARKHGLLSRIAFVPPSRV
jgi:integrase